MLGHRGCRLGISFPEITQMQSRAILEAAVELSLENVTVLPEIMVPWSERCRNSPIRKP